MADVGFVLLLVGFFGLCVLLVKACDRVIGPEVVLPRAADANNGSGDNEPVEVAA